METDDIFSIITHTSSSYSPIDHKKQQRYAMDIDNDQSTLVRTTT